MSIKWETLRIKSYKKIIIWVVVIIVAVLIGAIFQHLNQKTNSNNKDEFGLPLKLGADDWPIECDKKLSIQEQKEIYFQYEGKYEIISDVINTTWKETMNSKNKYKNDKFIILQQRIKLYYLENLSSLGMSKYYLNPIVEMNNLIKIKKTLNKANDIFRKNQNFFDKEILSLNEKHINLLNIHKDNKGE